MIAGIGTDLVEIGRIEEMLHRGSRLTRIFTTTELACAKDNTSISYGSIPKKPVPNTLETASFTAKLPAKVAALSFAHANSVVVKILVRRLPL